MHENQNVNKEARKKNGGELERKGVNPGIERGKSGEKGMRSRKEERKRKQK